MNMIFDIDKVQDIETQICKLFETFPTSDRCAKIIYSPCMKSLFAAARTQKLISNKYKVYSLNQILESANIKEEKGLFRKIVEKVLASLLGFIPILGSYFSIAILLTEISKEIVDEKGINNIEKYLCKSWKKHKRHKKVKYVVYVEDSALLSKRELICLQVISFLISQKYLVNTAILVAQPSDMESHFISNCVTIKRFDIEDSLANEVNKENLEVRNSLTILNIVGIDYVEKLNIALTQGSKSDRTIEAIVNCILKEKNIESNIELEKLLNSCSLLFEEFELKDVEYISKLQKNKEYQELFTLAQNSEIIKGINLQKFYFLQPFLREYYQQKKYSFPSDFYNSIYSYLEEKYSSFYEDLAIASALLLSDGDLILSQNILAYYYSRFSMPGYKLNKIIDTLKNYPLGLIVMEVDNLYNNSDCNSERSKIICTDAFREVKGSGIIDEAKLAALSFIVRLYYEIDVSQNEFVDVSKYYRSLLAKIKIYSSSFLANWNYALDYIVFSTCIDDDYPTRNAVQKLVAAIQKIDVSKLQKEKYLKYLRLGNAIYPESTQKAGALLLQGYNLSKDYTYLHTLFGINYSTTLILEGNYNEAKAILDSIVKLGLKSQAITMSAQNNYIIAKYLSKQNDVSVYIEQMSKFCITPHQSDYCICINNYISLKIMSGTKELHNEIKMCYEIINNNDQYHSFYARHNLVVIYFLINDVRFWDCIKDLSTPYLLNYYEPLFFEKINFLKNNFDKVWNINELTTALSKNLRENGFYDTSHFNSLPVLFGLIERWFE